MKYIIKGIVILVFAFIVGAGFLLAPFYFLNKNSNSKTVDQEASYKEMERFIKEDSGIEFPSDMVLVVRMPGVVIAGFFLLLRRLNCRYG